MKKYELRYRVIPNSTCNDFNNELPYTLVTVDYDTKTNLIRQRGFNSWSKHNCDLFTDRKYAEKWLCELNYNTFFNKEQKDQRIIELEKELEELKEKAIVPRFKLGQEVWYVYNKYQKFPFRCVIDKIVYDSSKNHKFRYDTSGELYIGIKEEDLFATKEEAQEKLKELRNERRKRM